MAVVAIAPHKSARASRTGHRHSRFSRLSPSAFSRFSCSLRWSGVRSSHLPSRGGGARRPTPARHATRADRMTDRTHVSQARSMSSGDKTQKRYLGRSEVDRATRERSATCTPLRPAPLPPSRRRCCRDGARRGQSESLLADARMALGQGSSGPVLCTTGTLSRWSSKSTRPRPPVLHPTTVSRSEEALSMDYGALVARVGHLIVSDLILKLSEAAEQALRVLQRDESASTRAVC